jgi:hypothetical protein
MALDADWSVCFFFFTKFVRKHKYEEEVPERAKIERVVHNCVPPLAISEQSA